MKILNQQRAGNKVTIEAEAEAALYTAAIAKAYEEAGKDVRLPGFRPGKAPKKMLEQTLNRAAIENHAAQELISDLYPKLIEETNIQPIDYPSVELVKAEAGQLFVFKLTVEVYPEVKLGKYQGLKAERRSTAVTEDDVIKVLGNLQERFSPLGKEGAKELLPLDDEFAKKVSRFGSLAELKAEINDALTKEKVAEADAALRDQLVAGAADAATIDLPAAMIEREIDIMLDELKTSLAQNRLTLDDYLKGTKKESAALREEMKKSAAIRVKGKIVLNAIAAAENIVAAPEDIQAEVKAMAEATRQPVAELEKNLSEGSRDYIKDYLMRKKALDFLVEKADIKEVSKP